MSTAISREDVKTTTLVEGQRLDQPAFHALYEAMPPSMRAELIGGIVSMPSPLGIEHGDGSKWIVVWIDRYEEFTPGVQALDGATVILDARNEPQPDVTLRVLPEYGGRTRNEEGYVAGAPELVVEVARSTRYMDLGPKLDQYERAGVLEYVVRAMGPDELAWFVRENDRFVELAPDTDGLFKSRVFPGLWLDPIALLKGDRAAVRAASRTAVDRGLASPEHAAFVAALKAGKHEKIQDS